jgi:hypothetical protein
VGIGRHFIEVVCDINDKISANNWVRGVLSEEQSAIK